MSHNYQLNNHQIPLKSSDTIIAEFISAFALLTVSSHSFSGTES